MLQEFQCPLPVGGEAVYCRSLHYPLPPGSEAVHCRSCTTQRTKAVRQCIAGVPLPTACRRCGGALQEYHYPLPSAQNYSAEGHTQYSALHSTKQCGTTQKALMVQRGTQVQWAYETMCDRVQAWEE